MNSTQDETRSHVAGEVRAELARQRLPIREVARRMGATHSWLHRRVTGDTDFTVAELAELADLLGVPVEKFFRGRRKAGVKMSTFSSLVLRRFVPGSSSLPLS